MTGNELHKGQVLFTTEAPMGNVAQVPDNKGYILSQRTIAFDVKANDYLEAATVQGFTWDKSEYRFEQEHGDTTTVSMHLDEKTYLVLALRYR